MVGLAAGILLGKTVFKTQCSEGLCKLGPTSFNTPATRSPSAGGTSKTYHVAVAGRPAEGPLNAKVTFVEFADFQCPFCGAFARDTLPTLLRRYRGRIRFVVREFPLTNIHPFAHGAALAAECAYRQGRFFQYYDVLYRHQDALRTRDLERYARRVGISEPPFARCLRSRATAPQVRRDLAAGKAYGVTGTPTFFVNGHTLVGNQPLAAFEQVLDSAFKGRSG